VDDEEEQRQKLEDVDMENEEDAEDAEGDDKEARRLKTRQAKEADKLEARLTVARERLKALTEAEEALELQRAKMAKSPTVGGVTKQGLKFKVRERKR
jgi:U3 small nucleolar RNA-associated protein 11